MRRQIRRATCLISVVAHVIGAFVRLTLVFPYRSAEYRRRATASWATRALGLFGISLSVRGAPASPVPSGVLLVANHTSWLDIQALLAAVDTTFVAKSEVRRWPVFGWIATEIGSLFVERERPRALAEANAAIQDLLAAVKCVTGFAE